MDTITTPKRNKAEIQIHGILAGLSTTAILAAVQAEYPGAATSKACVAWYRAHLKLAALPPTDPRHDKRYAKYLAGGKVIPPAGANAGPAGTWKFVPAAEAEATSEVGEAGEAEEKELEPVEEKDEAPAGNLRKRG